MIRVLNNCICQKTMLAIFEKKAFSSINAVSLKMKVESPKWQPLPASGAPGFISLNFFSIFRMDSRKTLLNLIVDFQFQQTFLKFSFD